MPQPSKIYEAVAQIIVDTEATTATAQIVSSLGGGFSAGTGVAVSTSGEKSRVRGAFSGTGAVFEGTVTQVARSMWFGEAILGGSVGIRQDTAGIVEGLRLYVKYGDGGPNDEFVGSLVDSLASDEAGYWTGGFVDALATDKDLGAGISIYAMSLSASLFRIANFSSYSYFEQDESAVLYLDGVYNGLSNGDVVIVEADGKVMASSVIVSNITSEGLEFPLTRLEIYPATIVASPGDEQSVRIWFNAKKAGTLERIPTKTVTKSDFLNTPRPVTLPTNTPLPAEDTYILIQDAEGTTLRAKGGGELISDTPHIRITELLEDVADDDEFVKPITFLWGLTKVTRGQTVNREVIGSGDAFQRWQSFRLAKSPLTYVADPFAPGGRRPELDVYVNGIKWQRAQSFYKATATDEIYVIRHDAEHNTFIQFGDGELGKRLPTGSNNVVATYRFGVGGNVEANTITKLVRPIKGVSSVSNPLPATGGEDPPTEEQAREKAIQSTRVLGHLVSLPDFEVEAARYGGVVRAGAKWAWDKAGEDAVVKVYIVTADAGDPSVDLRSYLMNMAEPGVRVQVSKAKPYTGELHIDLELDPDYLPEEVRAAVDARLFDEFDGLLAPRNVPIGGAFHRSELFAAIHEIAGVLSVQGVFLDGVPMSKYISLAEDEYLAIAYPEAG